MSTGPLLPRSVNLFVGSVMVAFTAVSIRATWALVTDSFMWMMLDPTESGLSAYTAKPSCMSSSHWGE